MKNDFRPHPEKAKKAISKNKLLKTNGSPVRMLTQKPGVGSNSVSNPTAVLGAGAGTSFDWRNYKNENWMTSVKDQGGCGSCWAFSAVGAVEAKYNINENNSRLNPNLAEEYLVSCDHSCYPGYSYPHDYCQGGLNGGGCNGGYLDLALGYIKDSGISDENCFPYTATNDNCNNKCADSTNRSWTIGGANYSGYWTNFTNEELEEWIIDRGPLSIAMGILAAYGGGFDGNCIYRCTNDSGANHGVILVGYNDTETQSTSYWIIKNSWGVDYDACAPDGYFKLGFGECNIGDEVNYVNLTNPPNFKPTISLHSPEQNYLTNNQVEFNFTVINRVSTSSTCDLIIDGIINKTNISVINNTPTAFISNLSEGINNWSITCWENGIGVPNRSETRTLNVDQTAPSLTINSPSEGDYLNSTSITINLTATDTNLNYTNISITNSTGDLINSTTNSTNGTYTLTISVSTDGVYNLTATAYDLTNNSNSTTNANITIDTTKPNVNIINSSFNTTDPTPSIYFNFTDSLSPNASCVLYFNNSAVGNSTAQNNTNTVITVNATTADGAYNVYVRCMDLAGNFNQSENITVTIDTLPPEVSLIYPVNNTLSSDASILLNWSVDNAGISIDKVWYLLDNKITKHFLSGGATNSTLVNFTAGTHTLILKANDTLNNIGASGEITFTVNIPVNATEIINNLINAAGNNLLLDASISNSSGGDQSNNANLTINQTLSMTMKINSSGTNATVTIPEFNGLKANWNETFDIRVNISSSIANNIINSSGTNVTKLFVFVNSGDFLDNKDYLNGSTITVYYNLTEDLDVLYINDDFGLQVYKLSYCNQIPTGKVNYPPASWEASTNS